MGSTSKLFKFTFLFSLLVHAVFFLPIPEIKKPKQTQDKQPQLSYLSIKEPVKKKTAVFKHKKIKPEHKKLLEAKKLTETLPENSLISKDVIKTSVPEIKRSAEKSKEIVKLNEKQQILTRKAELEKKDLSKNKSYISYYKLINEQLRQSVIYPSHFSEGEIGLSFILDSDGGLKDVKVIKTTAAESEVLKETAMQIVKRAAPFPPFPKNLQQTQLTFNIVFCFKESS